jgi:signal transduction histidine kinase
MTIRLRLTLVYSAILMLTLLVFGILLYTIQSQDTVNKLKQDLRASSLKFNETLKTQPIPVPPEASSQNSPPSTFNQFSDEEAFRTVREREILRILDENGNLIASPFGKQEDALPLSDSALATLQQNSDVFETGDVSGEQLLIYSRPIIRNGELVFIIQVARSLTERNRTLQSLASTLSMIGFVMLVVAFGVGWVLSGLALRPIDRMTQTAQQIGEERDFSRRVDYSGKQDEVGKLANTFNQMLAGLQTAYQKVEHALEQQRNFVSDVSHELRTPLTTLRGNLGLLLHKPPVPEDVKEDIVTDMVDESDRMIRLVNELLMLAHADAGRSLAKEPIAINPVVEEITRQANFLAQDRKINVQLDHDVDIQGDRDAFKQILLILIDNAIKYSQQDIRVITQISDKQLVISVEDQGQGIPEEDLSRVFDRFYRAEDNSIIHGFGLGLPIAKSLVEAMNGMIEIESRLGIGSVVKITFPIK